MGFEDSDGGVMDGATGGAEVVVARPGGDVPAELAAAAGDYARAAKAPNTWRAYESDMRHFAAWCAGHGLSALPAPPEVVAGYLTDHAGRLAVATLRRRISALAVAHASAGYRSPTADPRVAAVWDGIRRTHGRAPRRKTAAVTEVVAALVAPLGDALADRRDRALVVIGFAGAFRRSELAGLDVADVAESADGLVVTVARSKTDQHGEGALVGLPYGSSLATCPVRSWRAWLAASGITDGPAFRPIDRHGRLSPRRMSDRAVAEMLKRRATAAGVDGDFAGHSLRRGFATAAARAGVSERAIMRQGRWRSTTTMRRYIADGELFTENAAARLGL